MFVKVTFNEESILFKNDLQDFGQLQITFKNLLKIDDSQQFVFVYKTKSDNQHIILNNEDLKTVKEIVGSENVSLVNLRAILSNDESLKSLLQEEQNNSMSNDSDTEVLQKDDSDEFQLISEPRKIEKIESPKIKKEKKVQKEKEEKIEEAVDAKEAKKQKNLEKVQKIVKKEIKKQIPFITEQVRAQIMKELSSQGTQSNNNNSSNLSSGAVSNEKHLGFICDGCEASPIIGVRYKCITCQDFDLCEKCEANGTHSHHAFLKIRKPELAPQMLVCVEADSDAQDLIAQLPADQRHRVIDVDFNTLFGTFNSNTNTASNKKKEDKPKKEKKEKKPKQEKKDKKEKKIETPTAVSTSPIVSSVAEKKTIPEIVASVVGGSPSDYTDICVLLEGFSADEIIEAVLANIEQFNIEPRSVQKVEPIVEKPVVVIPEKVQSPVVVSTPMPEEVRTEKKSCDNEMTFNAKLIASIVDGDEKSFELYVDLIKQNPQKSIEQLIDLVFDQRSVVIEAPKKVECSVLPIFKEVKFAVEEKKPVVVEEKKPVVVEEKQQESFPPALKKKAEEVAEIMGGKYQDYINIILNLPFKSTVQEIIENLIAQGEHEEKSNNSRSSSQVEKVQPIFVEEKKPVVEEKKSEIKEEPKKVLRKKFSNSIMKKAEQISEILGESAENYYGVVDAYCLSTVNEIIEIILNDSQTLSKFSSFKN